MPGYWCKIMYRYSKSWGECILVRHDIVQDVFVLKVKKNHRSSWHRHKHKFNLFYVVEGEISIFTEGSCMKAEHVVNKNQCFNVSAGEWHEFRGNEDSIVIEISGVENRADDIERKDAGGFA